ncbi:MAG: (Na+)-NQR maturation NqrM [Pseudomonadota bacterium]
MSTFIISFAIFSLVMVAMAVGVIVNNRAIKGSCGGLNDIDGLEGACDICEVKEQCKRRKRMQRKALTGQAHGNQPQA